MLSSVANALIAFATLVQVPFGVAVGTNVQLSASEQSVWQKVQSSIMVLSTGGLPKGAAACIDPAGLFMAHQNSWVGGSEIGLSYTGQTYKLHLISSDHPTGLILLQADDSARGKFLPIKIADQVHARKGTLIAILGTGPVRAEIARADIVATNAVDRQSVMVNEIRFDAPTQLLSGALIFDDASGLVGVLGATLSSPENLNKSAIGRAGGGFGAQTNGQAYEAARGGAVATGGLSRASYGPQGLTVAYAISPMLLNQVVTGFVSPTHQVDHPALGAICADSFTASHEPNGAEIRKINAKSSAAHSGLRVGDVIVNINGIKIATVIDYARTMLSQTVGHRITLVVHRGADSITIEAVVGRVDNAAQLQSELPTNSAGR